MTWIDSALLPLPVWAGMFHGLFRNDYTKHGGVDVAVVIDQSY
jgi:hypothetical protein